MNTFRTSRATSTDAQPQKRKESPVETTITGTVRRGCERYRKPPPLRCHHTVPASVENGINGVEG
ncbi:hypothetical protein [Haladaptatus halobius]|uniref:hypothetical protein n=1 Tax=Haladaptatus halobius TaxID=2884875 RepID=UPI001D0A701C|nr:hypothetical protein [Haladaptatus halobius]